MRIILNSIRVVELTEALAGGYCATLLGEHTADILRSLGYSDEDVRTMARESAISGKSPLA